MNITVLSGAGMSAESGLNTFRDNDGLWNNYNVYDVATPEAWEKNRKLVLEFYNERRKQLQTVEPNEGHFEIAKWQDHFNVQIITQNVDNLHERAGSKSILHLHGELVKSRTTGPSEKTYLISDDNLEDGDLCPEGYQLRPHVVWFGENVPAMDDALKIIPETDILVIVGTSLNVYPAAGLAFEASSNCPIYVVDPKDLDNAPRNAIHLKEKAISGLKKLTAIFLQTT
jgi:NAD-dependent deacetylase